MLIEVNDIYSIYTLNLSNGKLEYHSRWDVEHTKKCRDCADGLRDAEYEMTIEAEDEC